MLTKRRVLATATAAASVFALVVGWTAANADPAPTPAPDRGLYSVSGADDVAARTQVANSGVDVLDGKNGTMEVVASPAQADALRGDGFSLTLTGDFDKLLAERSGGVSTKDAADFPAGDENYHTYDEMVAEINKAKTDHADIVSVGSIGKSYEGRDLPIVKISDNVGTDEDEPEVLFTCNMHAREHLTLEMCLHIVARFTDGYGSDQFVTDQVNGKEIWVVPSQNPDGAEADIQGGQYQGQRKNMQPNDDGSVGTDTNRNFDYKWGCCGGSSDNPSDETYRGPSAASAPEVKAVQDWVNSRVVGGTQQLKGHIDFHTFSELVMWPFGHTDEQVTEGMTQEEYDRFVKVGEEMAGSNGYTPEQSSALYITDGDITDWMWGQARVFSFVFEMYPADGGIDGFYPPDEVIPEQTSRNDGAVDILLNNAT
jgi:carboxypeptidase T